MSIRNNRSRLGNACLAALGLLGASGCGDEETIRTAAPQALRPVAAVSQTAAVIPPAPDPASELDPLAVPDPLAAVQDDQPANAPTSDDKIPDPLADGDDPLNSATGPKMPTQHSHWLSLAQSGERVTVRLNGVWYGDFSGPTLRDITMALRPGPNTLTVTYHPQDADSWIAVRVTEGEHSPPIPDLVTYRAAPLRKAVTRDMAARPAATTRTFRFTAQ